MHNIYRFHLFIFSGHIFCLNWQTEIKTSHIYAVSYYKKKKKIQLVPQFVKTTFIDSKSYHIHLLIGATIYWF